VRRITSWSDEIKIAGVAAICLIGLTVVLKNIVNVSPEVLSRDIIIYIIIYSGFWLLPSLGEGPAKIAGVDRSVFGSAFLVIMTVAIITVYAI